jgi:hypothetical protein
MGLVELESAKSFTTKPTSNTKSKTPSIEALQKAIGYTFRITNV